MSSGAPHRRLLLRSIEPDAAPSAPVGLASCEVPTPSPRQGYQALAAALGRLAAREVFARQQAIGAGAARSIPSASDDRNG